MDSESLGVTQEGLQAALGIKKNYQEGEPVCMPGEKDRILLPEYLLNSGLNLSSLEDPLPLAMLATRDPEAPMSIAAPASAAPWLWPSPSASGNDMTPRPWR